MRKIQLGRHVLGLGAIAFGVIAFIWRDLNIWPEIQSLRQIFHPHVLFYIFAAVELFAGIAMQWPKTMRVGSLALAAFYVVLSLLALQFIVEDPRTYNDWGNLFYHLSLLSGALIVYSSLSGERVWTARLARIAYLCFGICVISFTVEQAVYLHATVVLVPKWIPPGQMFWAIATTAAFALAALALLSGRQALLASRLLTAMLIAFGVLVWLPAIWSEPHKLTNWTENAENLAIAGAAWVVAEFLSKRDTAKPSAS